jgi:hypothetical protein
MTAADAEEWHDAVDELSELERVQACGHWWNKGHCMFCGEGADDA